MMLGLVLHSALTYNVTVHGNVWNIKDTEATNITTDFLVLMIHSFRMPIFFLIAGFFGALLFYERKPWQMIKNRTVRIVIPFIVFLLILTPIMQFSFGYASETFGGQENALTNALALFSEFSVYIPKSTSHLWFLYYLFFATTFTVLLAFLLKKTPKLTQRIKKNGNYIFHKPVLRILFFSGITFFILTVLKTPMVASSTSLIPDTNTFVYYTSFYLIGWLLYTSKQQLETLKKYDWLCVILAILLVVIQGILIQYADLGLKSNTNSPLLIAFSSSIVWLFIFGITGLFIRYGSHHSTRMRYISDASYWVYLIHLPLTALFPILLQKVPINGILKFLIVTIATAIVCFTSYHFFVRNTFIGKFLNGRKYPKNLKSL
ncbi:2,3,4,5-tetrahydropyridine-2-carboxylate N-succinyltransferase [Kordia algicida OT-1]|uniref:2,3,4,5-tetrahydropyridine-2-carboxylate N-succinyltransferase n=2 Tax=Kordia TaxID=221065 RepID=A9EAZ3_9FLAO|nr:2,3,4,5-tetrahydropyridine-2-carboxylate N-succinyltransferase [Kordia algicida OT-1]